jgi:hypothetical protein
MAEDSQGGDLIMAEVEGGNAIPEGELQTSIMQLPVDQDPKYLGLKSEVARILEFAIGRKILSPDGVKLAVEDLSVMSNLKKAIKERQGQYTRPLKEYLDNVNQIFIGVLSPLDQADKITREKILSFRAEEERKRKEIEEINRMRLEASQREAKLKDGEITETVTEIPVPESPASNIKTDIGNLGTSKVWKFEVTDFKSLPDEYKMVDASKLGKVVRAGLHDIPGVRTWQEETLRVTSK